MTKNKNLFKNISILFCLVPMLLLSLICLVPKNNKMSVSALGSGDQVITNFNFVSTNLIIPVTMEKVDTGVFDRQTFACLTLSFGVQDGIYRAFVDGYVPWPELTGSDPIYGLLEHVPNREDLVSRSIFLKARVMGTYASGYNIIVSHSGQISSDIVKCKFSHYTNLTPNLFKPADYYNTVTYYDREGEFIEFAFPLFTSGSNFAVENLFEERYYYFTASFDDNTFYNEGYDVGYDKGFFDGTNEGYDIGYDAGNTTGFGNGYNAGLEQSGKYSFISLIGAVIDAPVSAFTSLLNFELLGFNILGFITGLLTLALIVFIIKLCLGGK